MIILSTAINNIKQNVCVNYECSAYEAYWEMEKISENSLPLKMWHSWGTDSIVV